MPIHDDKPKQDHGGPFHFAPLTPRSRDFLDPTNPVGGAEYRGQATADEAAWSLDDAVTHLKKSARPHWWQRLLR